ncbi:MAG: lipoyl synthase [Candidatus Eisenbacteria sp.]|nr:lipoyl synthase [Candidatus Eisenbacteria bacterium]
MPERSRWHGLAVLLAGHCAYEPMRRVQQQIWELRRRLELPDTLLLLEHHPVVTLGRHADERHVLQPDGVTVVRTDRGGDVTYHGPGQLTAYLLADLKAHDCTVRRYITLLEECVLGTLSDYRLEGFRRPGLTGVWVGGAQQSAKIAAIGVRVSRWISLHGLAFNVRAHAHAGFERIIPCGLSGERVTSLEGAGVDPRGGDAARSWFPGRARAAAEVGDEAVAAVAARLERHVGEAFRIDFQRLAAGAVVDEQSGAELLRRLRNAARRGARKPAWLRVRLPGGSGYARVRAVLRRSKVETVCERARCPNCHECWNAGTATFMILGTTCTRGCRFCAVERGAALPGPDPREPAEVARAAALLGLRHVVVTSVTRDDLPDGGAGHFVGTIAALRARVPQATVEVLIPDFAGREADQDQVFAARPEILNHNVETVARLYPQVRPGAGYRRSLTLLARAAAQGLATKSGFMVGLGESPREIGELLRDLRTAGCQRVTIGQYLQPTGTMVPVKRYYTPAEFTACGAQARELGFVHVESGPMVRSSYHAAASL